jgi:hypothetical protein
MDEATVSALYEEWARAVGERDAEALERLFDPQYAYTSPLGQRVSRAEMLELEMRLPAPQLPLLSLDIQPVTDDVMIARGNVSLKGAFPLDVVDETLVERIREGIEIAFTSVWRRRNGDWRLVSNDAHIVSSE